ncbi:MAG TPA: dienelactone hydrolase family protein [candidate division Zixibacteria bacterium]|nr:dienelactone hydrolase family protein [candidate division Zixibacteria bacterium]
MAEKIKALIREYREGRLSRREFMRQAVLATGTLAGADSLIRSLIPSGAHAAQVPETDPAILTHNVEYKGKAGPIFGYLARPVKAGRYPAVIVIHENRGLNDHIRDMARRFAKEGYVALAPDYLSRAGGTPKVNPKGEGLSNIRELAPWQNVAEDTASGFEYLKVLPDVRGDKQAVVGFCWGGEMAFASATQIKTLDAVVVYYGRSPNPLDLVKNIQAPVLAHYGEKDPGVNKGIPDTEAAMKKYNKSYTYKIYPGAQHAFNNDTGGARYHPQAAKEAWERTLEFLRKNLRA